MPRVTKGITDVSRQQVEAINSNGTQFKLKFTDPDFDKWVCMPGAQVVDMAEWMQELLIILKASAKK